MKMNKINIVFFIYKYLKFTDQYVENIIRRVKKYRQYDSTQLKYWRKSYTIYTEI